MNFFCEILFEALDAWATGWSTSQSWTRPLLALSALATAIAAAWWIGRLMRWW